jgi:predicted PurR-regulated permease PerM
MMQGSPWQWRQVVILGLTLLVTALTFWLIIRFGALIVEIGMILFMAYLLSLAIRPAADMLARWHVPRILTVLIVYVGILSLLIALGIMLVPVIRAEVASLKTNGPTLMRDALDRLSALSTLSSLIPSADNIANQLLSQANTVAETLLSTVSSIGSLALDLVLVLVLAFYFSTGGGQKNLIGKHWLPAEYQERFDHITKSLQKRLTRWLLAQVAIALYFAVAFSIGLTLLGVPFALTIGLVGGLLEIIPYLGGVVALLLAIFSALTVNPTLVIGVGLIYLVVSQLEAHIVGPALYGRAVGLHPAVVLVALLVGGTLGGIIGILLAVPAAVALVVLIEELQSTFTAFSTGSQDD